MRRRSLYVFVGVIVIGVLMMSVSVFIQKRDPYSMVYKGVKFTFRRKIKDAYSVPIHNKTVILKLIAEPPILVVGNEPVPWKVHIAFPNTSTSGIYAVEGFELAMKLKTYYLLNNMRVEIKGVPISSEEELRKLGESVIYLVGPELVNETKVYVDGNVVYVMGKDEEGFDLATMRLILLVLNRS